MKELWYYGKKEAGAPSGVVRRNGQDLDPEPASRRVQWTDGVWCWGKGTDSERQLAYALLLDATRSVRAADRWSGAFARSIIAGLPDQWVLTRADINRWYMTAPGSLLEESNVKTEENTHCD